MTRKIKEPKPKIFEFSHRKIEGKKLVFGYKVKFSDKKTLSFTETIILPSPPDLKKIPPQALKKILRDLHIVLGVSYYKLYLPPTIQGNLQLTPQESHFWQEVYEKGLGEFFYRNNLIPKKIKFPWVKKKKSKSFLLPTKKRVLLGMGGGKDSIVALEILKESAWQPTLFVVETNRSYTHIDNIVKKSGLKIIKIKRVLDEKLFQPLPGALKGHIPISAIYSFLGIATAIFYQFRYFIVANEYSSDFGNVEYHGKLINHQWSKSSQYEKLLGDYLKNFLTPNVKYFSVLRPFYELRVAKMFSKYKKYFPYFSSCNQALKIKNPIKKRWCLNCPKCAFVFTILSPFLSKTALVKIFGENLFEKESLLPVFSELLGFSGIKPFECVGTPQETRMAFLLAANKFKNSLAFKKFLPRIKKEVKNPKELSEELFSTQKSDCLPHEFRFCGIENVLILGYGSEGQASRAWIKKMYPQLKIGIADQKFSKDYLEKQKKYDLVIKTPGIPKEKVHRPYTTSTNLFFSQIENPVIGVTGSKGKSTTASLIYHILATAGKNVELLGNIGKSPLSALLKPVNKNKIFVLELSSFQLDDIEFSPWIAVITTLFPEHHDYHKNIKNYYKAKKNIIRFQKNTDYFVYNPKNPILKKWAKNCPSKSVPFVKNLPLKKESLPLLGEHNIDNAKAAVAVAKILNIPEKIIKTALLTFKPLPHRLEFVGEFKGIKFYNDAISTTPQSTIAAIKALKNIGTIFLGGTDRGYNFKELEKTIRKYKIKNVVLFPESGRRILKSKKSLNVLFTKSMAKAVRFAFEFTPKGKICLLSTASPSYSLWKNFEEKGNQFKFFVKKYGK